MNKFCICLLAYWNLQFHPNLILPTPKTVTWKNILKYGKVAVIDYFSKRILKAALP